jgi:superoxide reductase
MSTSRAFYRCTICGNLVGLIHDGGGELVCCGQPMVLLQANTTDAATEKHVPVVTREGNKLHVAVGSVPHPMLEAHYIQWICVVQEDKTQRAILKPGQAPEADFVIEAGAATVYEYCNLHGLWKTELS